MAVIWGTPMPATTRVVQGNEIRCSLASARVYPVFAAYDGNIRLYHGIDIQRAVPVLFKEPDIKRSRINPARLSFQIICKLPANLHADFLMHAGWRSHEECFPAYNLDTFVFFPYKTVSKCIPCLFCRHCHKSFPLIAPDCFGNRSQ